MGTVYKKYTKDFKMQVCKMVCEEHISVSIVQKQFGIPNVQLVYKWLAAYRTYGDEAFVGYGKLRSEDAKLRKLVKEIERLKLENELLKKLQAYLAEKNATK